MSTRSFTLALVLAVGGIGGAAQASIIGGNTLNTPLSSAPLPIVLGSGAAAYAFTAATAVETGNGLGAAVATSGAAQAAIIFGSLTDFGLGATIDGQGLFTFSSFSSRTVIQNSPADDFIGLAFMLPDGLHYGYAEVSGPTLVRFAYESAPGIGIITGAAATPEPTTVALLGIGLVGLVAARRRTGA